MSDFIATTVANPKATRKDLIKFIEEEGTHYKCPYCGDDKWIILCDKQSQDEDQLLSIFDITSTKKINYPHYGLSCNKCGSTSFINAYLVHLFLTRSDNE